MIHYTMMPPELIYPTNDRDYQKQSVVEVDGVQLLVQETSEAQLEIIRVLSSDPNHFLNEGLCPGQKITSMSKMFVGDYYPSHKGWV